MQTKEKVYYNDGDIIISDDIFQLEKQSGFRYKMLYVTLCVKGKAKIDINGNTYNISPDDTLFLLPQSLISDIQISEDFSSISLAVRMTQLNKLLHSSARVWSIVHSLFHNPVMNIGKEDLLMRDTYLNLIIEKVKQTDLVFHADIIRSLFQTILYEIFSDIVTNIKAPKDEYVRQGDILFKKFMELLNNDGGRNRSVSYYADKLFVTPKHLSSVCKNVTGESALEIIFRHVENIIRNELKHSDKSIKELCEELNFSNISFFGKFVKSRLGASPTDLRKAE